MRSATRCLSATIACQPRPVSTSTVGWFSQSTNAIRRTRPRTRFARSTEVSPPERISIPTSRAAGSWKPIRWSPFSAARPATTVAPPRGTSTDTATNGAGGDQALRTRPVTAAGGR